MLDWQTVIVGGGQHCRELGGCTNVTDLNFRVGFDLTRLQVSRKERQKINDDFQNGKGLRLRPLYRECLLPEGYMEDYIKSWYKQQNINMYRTANGTTRNLVGVVDPLLMMLLNKLKIPAVDLTRYGCPCYDELYLKYSSDDRCAAHRSKLTSSSHRCCQQTADSMMQWVRAKATKNCTIYRGFLFSELL